MGTRTLLGRDWLSNAGRANREPWTVEQKLHLGLAAIAVPSKPTARRWEKVAYRSPANIREDGAVTDRHAANVTRCPFSLVAHSRSAWSGTTAW